MNKLKLLFFLSFISVNISAQQAANQFRRIHSDWGLSNNQINTIFSDSRGFMWFGTVSGLNRYDGYNFKVFKHVVDDPFSIPENSIHQIFEDHLGLLWLLSGSNELTIYDPETESFGKDHELFHKNIALPRENINTIRMDRDSCLWFSYDQHGLYFYNKKHDALYSFCYQPGSSASLSSDLINDVSFCSCGKVYVVNDSGIIDIIDPQLMEVVENLDFNLGASQLEHDRNYRLFIDSEDDFWIYSVNYPVGLFYINRRNNEIQEYSPSSSINYISSKIVTGIIEDSRGRIWVGTDHGGITIINKELKTSEVLVNVPGDDTSLSGNSITSLHKNKDGIIWVGTFKNGINYHHEYLFQFNLYKSQYRNHEQYFPNDVNCFAEDSKGNLWIGTNGEGLVYFDRHNNNFKIYQHQPQNLNSLSNDVIVSLFIDDDDGLWIGTYQGGLNYYDGSNFKHFKHNPYDPTTISDDRVWQIHRDTSDRLWIGTLGGGLCLFDKRTQGFFHYREDDYNSVNSDFILSLKEDSKGNLWIGTSYGLNVLDKESRKFRHYVHDVSIQGSISNNSILSIYEDAKNRMWIGTRNGLNLFDEESNSFKVFREKDGLPDHNIISVLGDEKGNLWIATLNGLSNMIINEKYELIKFRNYDVLDGLQGKEYNEHSYLKTSKGELIFGGAGGFNIFYPEEVIDYQQNFDVLLTDFKLFNNSVAIGEKKGGRIILQKAFNQTKQLSLKHFQNVFSIEFAALNYFHSERTRFRYQLEGFNTGWIETDSQNKVATYTNLNPGLYKFKVQAMSSDGTWSDSESMLEIIVIPPFYFTKWAYIAYFSLFVCLIFLLIWIIRRREKMKFLREQERLEFSRLHELDAMKLLFFTNVSHEFRTPLTLILSPLEKLLKEIKENSLREQLFMIQRNARRLLSLVNQLLDFRKMEVSEMALNPTFGDVSLFVRDAFFSFADLFENKKIKYNYSSNIDHFLVSFDADKMEKIIFNLVSNAIKFTPELGHVYCIVKRCKTEDENFKDEFFGREYLEIKIKDTGIGIKPENQKIIFERFYQGTENKNIVNQGSGIGLSLTKEFVKLHGGTITVESEPGKGSCFILKMPLQLKNDENDKITIDEENAYETEKDKKDKKLVSDEKPLVLLVEDNAELRAYLHDNLSHHFNIMEASNGAKAWEKTLEFMPHIIVSDIMMPVEDGIELCKKIKKDPRTSHIPVILLTAKVTNQQKIEGLEAGAEDYITKPFNYEVLELKIKRLIDLRISFQQMFNKKFEIKPGEISITSLDEKFLNKALKVVEDNIGNSEFSVEKMSRELGVSRGHLYNKLTALTGKTPVEFIRVMRLKRAAQFLQKSQLTVSEIAFKVGFNDPKYFSKYFKEEFGIVPSEYAKKNKY